MTVFGHQNGNRNEQFCGGFEKSFGVVLEQFWFSWRTICCINFGQFLREFQNSFGAVFEHCSPARTLGNAYTILRNGIHMNSQSRSRSDSMTTGSLKNDDRNWPRCSVAQRSAAHRTAPHRTAPCRTAPQRMNVL